MGAWNGAATCGSGSCVEVAGQAFCADSSQPIAECSDPSRDQHTTCVGNSTTYCEKGYPTGTSSCGARQCLMSSCGAVCAADQTPEPRCPVPSSCYDGDPDPRCQSPSFCDGDDAVHCSCDYVHDRTACGAGLCHDLGGHAVCTLSAAPDPGCGDAASPTSSFCSDTGIAYQCQYGYVTRYVNCGVGNCTVHVDGARCGP